MLLDAVGLSHRLEHRPGEMSGGECQRVAVARAMMNQPSIIMADEPTGNLDGEAAATLQRILEKLAREEKTTLVVATHNPEFAAAMDRIIHLHQGGIEEVAPQRIAPSRTASHPDNHPPYTPPAPHVFCGAFFCLRAFIATEVGACIAASRRGPGFPTVEHLNGFPNHSSQTPR